MQKLVYVEYVQAGDVIHGWETGMINVSLMNIEEAVFVTDLVDDSIPLEFTVYEDREDGRIELFSGKLEPAYMQMDSVTFES